MSRLEESLIPTLRTIALESSFNTRLIDEVLGILEDNVPEELRILFHMHEKSQSDPYWEIIKKKTLKEGDPAENQNKRFLLVKHFLSLLALLNNDLEDNQKQSIISSDRSLFDYDDHLPRFLNIKEGHPTEKRFIEIGLSRMGHYHDPDPRSIGKLKENVVDEQFSNFHSIWDHPDAVLDWLVPYICFRFMKVLGNIDMFYVIYSRIPKYYELKILTYSLMFLGREKFTPIHRFAKTAHELYSTILFDITDLFKRTTDFVSLGSPIHEALRGATKCFETISATTDESDSEYRQLILRINRKFFKFYIAELSHAGQFHTILWSLPMFDEAKRAFEVISNFGKTSFNILLIGESGSGKEAIAKLYLKSLGEYLIPINCAGKNWHDLYDDLFSTRENPLSLSRSTNREHPVPLSRSTNREHPVPLIASTKALLLDEIEKSSIDAQGGLLRLLDKPQGEIRFVGEATTVKWTGLVVATATESIYKKMKEDTFLRDLFWRFDVRVNIVPLRNMRAKAELFKRLCDAALNISLAKFKVVANIKYSEAQHEQLLSHPWYGNLRELLEMADNVACEVALAELGNQSPMNEEQVAIHFGRVFERYKQVATRFEKG